ncbi:MAG: hypothetical protein LBB21_03870 [Holosporaceae bacterium]|jgi:chemotaxis protein histidine kinase CheA|nr:hypothetical protein [Holosporaceae bacterium]
MRRIRRDNLVEKSSTIKSPIVYSTLAHLAVLALASMQSFVHKKNDVMLMDIQIASEGELQDILHNYQTEPAQVTPQEESKPVEEPKTDPIVEEEKPNHSQPDPEPESQPEPEPVIQESQPAPEPPPPPPPEEPAPKEEVVIDEPAQSENLSPTNTEPKEPVKEEIVEQEEPTKEEVKEEKPVVKEEPVPKIVEKPKEKEKTPETKKKPKKRDRKMLQEVIKHAEKKKAKEKSRKKILEITENAEKEKKTIKKKKNDSTFDKMLNSSINDLKKVSGKGNNGTGASSFGSGVSLTDADYEMISSQIYPHWSVPSGIRDVENIIIEIEVQLRDNGEVIPSSVKILDYNRYASDYIFRAAADSARRAVLEASPLRIPRDKMGMFKNFVLRFNLKEALGG